MHSHQLAALLWRRLGWLLGLGALLLALAYGLGYRLPGRDHRSDWPEFPHLTNPRPVVAEIPDFARHYGHRYHLPAAIKDPEYTISYEEYYQVNLRNVRTLSFQRTGNIVTWHWHLDFGTETNLNRVPAATPALVCSEGYQYLALQLTGVEGCFFQRRDIRRKNLFAVFLPVQLPSGGQRHLVSAARQCRLPSDTALAREAIHP